MSNQKSPANWRAQLQSSLQQVSTVCLSTITTFRNKALGPGGLFGPLQAETVVQVTPEAVSKIRWYETQDTAALAKAHSREKEQLYALNEALRQLLTKHGVAEQELDSQLSFQLEEVQRLRQADSGTYAVLLAAAHHELEGKRERQREDAGPPPPQQLGSPKTPPSVSPVQGLFAMAQPLSDLKSATRTLIDAKEKHPLPAEALQQLSSAVEALDLVLLQTPTREGAEQLSSHLHTIDTEGGAASLQAALGATQHELQMRDQELAALKTSMSGLQQELSTCRADAEHSLQELKSRLARTVNEHVGVLKQAQDICKSAEDRADASERKADMAEVRAATYESELKQAKADLKRQEKELKRLQGDGRRREDVSRLQARNKQLEEELATSSKAAATLKATCEQLEQRVTELQGVESSLSAELALAEEASVAREALLLRVQGLEESARDHAMVSEALEQHKSLVAELDARCAEQQQELVAAVQHAARLESRAISVEQDLQRSKTALQTAELRVLKAEQAVTQEVAKKLAAANEDPTQWPIGARAALQDAERNIEELKTSLSAITRERDAAVVARDTAREQQHALEQQLISAQERQARAEGEHRQRTQQLAAELRNAQEEIRECRVVIDAIQAQARETAHAAAHAARNGHHAAPEPREPVDMLYLKNVMLKFLDAFVHSRTAEVEALLPAVATVLRANPREYRELKQKVEEQKGWGSASSMLSALGISMNNNNNS